MLPLVGGIILAQASVGVSPSNSLSAWYAIAKPAFACERTLDGTRRAIASEQRRIDRLPLRSGDDDRVWREASSALQRRYQDFHAQRDSVCKTYDTFLKFRAALAKARPDLSAEELQTFAAGLFGQLQKIEEYAADFAAGHDATQFTPPQAPPPAVPR